MRQWNGETMRQRDNKDNGTVRQWGNATMKQWGNETTKQWTGETMKP